MGDFRELMVYKRAYEMAMNVFKCSQQFPKHESYSLTDQIRRSSRAVCALLAEAFRRKSYPSYFRNKIMEADGENSETGVWLDFAKDCGYLNDEDYQSLKILNNETGSLIGAILRNPEKYRN